MKFDDYDMTIYDDVDACYVETTESATDQINYKTAKQH